MRVGIIGGTGVYDPTMLTDVREDRVATPWGVALLRVGRFRGEEVAFLARHGAGHSVPPHKINYRANIWALKERGVERIIATAAVGSLRQELAPGHFVLVDQFLDFTKSRPMTFYDGAGDGVAHVDVTEPYCPVLRGILAEKGRQLGIPIHEGGTYVTAEGPRFETAAEIRMFRQLGGDVVGMTSVPEVVLAREAGLCYATVAMVTNYAAGISSNPLTHGEVVQLMSENADNLRRLVMETLAAIPAGRQDCACRVLPEVYGKDE